jgi:hypothetical protein
MQQSLNLNLKSESDWVSGFLDFKLYYSSVRKMAVGDCNLNSDDSPVQAASLVMIHGTVSEAQAADFNLQGHHHPAHTSELIEGGAIPASGSSKSNTNSSSSGSSSGSGSSSASSSGSGVNSNGNQARSNTRDNAANVNAANANAAMRAKTEDRHATVAVEDAADLAPEFDENDPAVLGTRREDGN